MCTESAAPAEGEAKTPEEVAGVWMELQVWTLPPADPGASGYLEFRGTGGTAREEVVNLELVGRRFPRRPRAPGRTLLRSQER